MKTKSIIYFVCSVALIIQGCSHEDTLSSEATQSDLKLKVSETKKQDNPGATQISGVGFFAEAADCDPAAEGADFALLMTGDLEGCLYVFVDEHECSPSGTYREVGRELFVGTYNGETGSFWTDYRFTAKFEGCSDDGFFLGAEIFGRCQHPIQKGSGDGVFEGVTGRLDFKDNVEDHTFPYTGHLKF